MKKILYYSATLLAAGIVFLLIAAVKPMQQKKEKGKKPFLTDTLTTNPAGKGVNLTVEFSKGKAHNHPIMAIWVEDTSGNYIQTLYIARSIATGIFERGDQSSGQWTKGAIRRPAALPYWGHKRGIKAEDGLYLPTPDQPVPDAYSGATPKNDFILRSRLDEKGPEIFNVIMEINQPWDWNDYWNNSKYSDDYEYKTSAQPAVVYLTRVVMNSEQREFEMKPVGRSHYSGKDGKLYPDTSTLTTALQIADKIIVKVER